MDIKYICTYWGCENLSAKEFLSQVIANGYDGVEINFPDDANFIIEFKEELEKIRNTTHADFIFIAQQVLSNKIESVDDYIQRIIDRLTFLTSLKPNYINSHTGKDFYEFRDNCKIIEIVESI
jgi:sugar phosphate isomerase/epimerase